MLRISLITVSILFMTNCLFGQIDIKIDPLSLGFSKNIKGGLEIGVEDNISIDVDGLFSRNINLPIIDFPVPGKSWGTRIIGKYYLNQKYSIDQFYVGPYFKYRRNYGLGFIHQRAAIGVITGFKFFTFDNFYLELGFGMGARVYSSLKNPVGDFIDDKIGSPAVQNFWDNLTNRVGRADLTSRLLIGYRIDGYGPRAKKQQEAEIRP